MKVYVLLRDALDHNTWTIAAICGSIAEAVDAIDGMPETKLVETDLEDFKIVEVHPLAPHLSVVPEAA